MAVLNRPKSAVEDFGPSPLQLTAAPAPAPAPATAPAPAPVYVPSFDPTALQYGTSGGTLANGMNAVGYSNGYVDDAGYHGDVGASGGYSASDPAHQSVGDLMYDYTPTGQFTGTHKITPENGTWKDLATGIATIAAAYFGANALFGGLGAGAGFAGDATAVGYDPLYGEAAGAGANTGGVLSKAALDGTNIFGANSVPGALDVTDLVNAAPGIESQEAIKDMVANLHAGDVNGLDLNSDIATHSGTIPDGSFNTGVNIGSGPFYNTSPLQLTFDPGTTAGSTFGLKPTDVIKLITTAVNAGGGSGGGGDGGNGGGGGGGTTQPFDYGPAQWLPPGWRNDRPMYVPGKDAIPDGWYGAGYTRG